MLSAQDLARFPQTRKAPLVVCTAYDFAFARIVEQAGVDVILVGDSLANVVLGLPTTRDVGMAEMELFGAAVRRGAPSTHVCIDLPYGADATVELAVRNATRLVEAGANSVKLEGPQTGVIAALLAAGIPVIGHLGVLPQTATSFRKVGLAAEDRARLLVEAQAIEKAGVCAMVLENVDADTARVITNAVAVPTIGIGAGEGTTGQVQVLHDLLGLAAKSPPFARPQADLTAAATEAVRKYAEWVRGGQQ